MELLIKSSIVIAILYGFYKLFLARESFFAVNRIYLLSCLLFAIAIPFLTLPKLHDQQGIIAMLWHSESEVEVCATDPTQPAEDCAMTVAANPELFNETGGGSGATNVLPPTINHLEDEASTANFHWLWYLYIFGAGILCLNLLGQIGAVLLKAARNSDKVETDEGTIVNLEGKAEPCSFFKFIFINPSLYDFETYDQILDHERIHVKKWHSLDLLLAEVAVILLWFNPFVWLLRKEIERNVEFQTDHLLISHRESEKESYQMNLVKIACNTAPLAITTNYNQSLIKSRILRMNSKKSNRFNYWKYVFSLPLLMVLTMALNLPEKSELAIEEPEIVNLISAIPQESDTEEPTALINPNCEEFERAVLEGDLEKVKAMLPTLDPECMGIAKAKESRTETTTTETTSTTTTTYSTEEDFIQASPSPFSKNNESACDEIRAFLDAGNFSELRRVLQYGDLSCMEDAGGGPSKDIPLIRGLMNYQAGINVIGYRQFEIKEVGFRIDVDDYRKGYCQDTNFLALAEAIIKKDELEIRQLLLTREFTCPLNMDGVSNDFPFIKLALGYRDADIVFHNNLGIMVYTVGLAIDMRTEDDFAQSASLDHVKAGYTCQGLIEALYYGDHSRAENLLGHVDLNCFQRTTETRTIDGKTTTESVVLTPLIIACMRGDLNTARVLLAHGADPEYRGDGAISPLTYALQSRNPDIVRLLVQYGAKLKANQHLIVTPWGPSFTYSDADLHLLIAPPKG